MNIKKQYELEVKHALAIVTAIVERHVLTDDEKYQLEQVQDFIKIAYAEKEEDSQ